MSDAEMLSYFKNTNELCGKFNRIQLDRPVSTANSNPRNAMWQKLVLLPSLLFGVPAIAQINKTEPVREVQAISNAMIDIQAESAVVLKKLIIEGTVTDSTTNEPLIGVVIKVKYGGDSLACITDFDGQYKIIVTCKEGDSLELKAYSTGYFTFKEIISTDVSAATISFNIALTPQFPEENPVVMVSCGRAIYQAETFSLSSRRRSFFYRLFHWQRR